MDRIEVQKIERRSIPFNNEVMSLPVSIDRSVFKLSYQDRKTLELLRANWKALQVPGYKPKHLLTA